MKFREWFDLAEYNYLLSEMGVAYTEPESNAMTEKLALWIKRNKRNPELSREILGGTAIGTDATRVGYDVDIEENELANFLNNRRDARSLGVNYFLSDEKILNGHGLDGLFGVDKKMRGEEAAIERARIIAKFYHDNEKSMPSERGIRTVIYNGIEYLESKIGIWLANMKRAKKGKGARFHYESAEKEGFKLGLPEDWLESRDRDKESLEQEAIEKARIIAKFYHDNEKSMPKQRGIRTVIYNGIEYLESKIGKWLTNMKSAKKGSTFSVHYENAEKEGFRLGLPEDWLESRDLDKESLEQEAIEKARIIAKFYNYHEKSTPKKLGIRTVIYNGIEYLEPNIQKWLATMKSAKKGIGTSVHYESAEKEGFRLGLPEDWLETREKKKRV